MKNMTAVKKALGIAALVAATNSWGYTIGGGATDVGSIDTFLSATTLANSGQQTETDWVNSLLDPDTTFTTKTETVSYSLVDGESSTYAFSLATDPGWYIIKNAKGWALFENVASLDWAVFSLDQFPSDIKFNLGKDGLTISHVSEFGGSTSVPEPGSVSLIAAGLLGLVAARRLANKKA